MCLQICIASLLTSSFVSCSRDADQALEKGRTIDGDVGENVSLVVSLFCSTSLWGFKVFEHYETKYFFPLISCVSLCQASRIKRGLRVGNNLVSKD